ncbi:TolC family protein [bacterium]|nr:TolC family protein [bacterium]
MSYFCDSTFSGASFKRALLSFFIIVIFFFLSAEVAEEEANAENSTEKPSENIEKPAENIDESAENKEHAAEDKTSENINKSANNAAPTVYTKEEFISKFIEKTGIGESSKYKMQMAEADYDYVIAQMFPTIKIVTGIGPHPRYVYEQSELLPDEDGDGLPEFKERKWHKYYSDLGKWGVAIRTKVEFLLPIYTFGKVLAGRRAAEAQIDVRKAESKIADLKIRKEAAAIYWSWVMAQTYIDIMEPAMKELDKAEEKLRDMLYEEKEGVTQKDLNKLLIEKEKVQYLYDRLLFQTDTLKSLITEVLGENWAFADKEMKKLDFAKEEQDLVNSMKENSPYATYLKRGLDIYEKLYKLEVRKTLPNFGMIGSYSFRYTSSVDEKYYPEANSPYNGYDGEIGVGLSFDLNIMEQVRKIQKAKAEWNYMKSKAFLVEQNVSLQVKRKYNDLKALDSHISHLKSIRKTTKGMLTTEYANYESGMTTGTKDLIDAVKAFFENEQEYVKAIYDYNMKIEDIIEFTGATEK